MCSPSPRPAPVTSATAAFSSIRLPPEMIPSRQDIAA